MKSAIVYSSVHHGNTAKVARSMADVLGAVLVKTGETPPQSLEPNFATELIKVFLVQFYYAHKTKNL